MIPAGPEHATPEPDRASTPLSATRLAGASDSGPLSDDHIRILTEARVRARKVRRAASVATFSGWSMACFAGITALGAVFGDLASLVVAIGLGLAAFNELRGGAMIRRFDPRGAKVLGINQLALAALIVAYAAWSLWNAQHSSSLAALTQSTGDPNIDAVAQDVTSLVTYAAFGGIAVIGLVVPGLTALYYFSRGPIVRAFVAGTPAWAVTALRAAQ